MAELFEKQLTSEQIYDGKVVKLYKDTVELKDGKTSVREIVRHPGAVCVVPITDKGQIIMVRQFRYPFGKVFLEIPAGKLEPGEDPRAAAMRELSEETGAETTQLEDLGVYCSSVAIFDEKIHMYLARGLKLGGTPHTDEGEFLEIVHMPFHDAVEMILDGKIQDGKTQTAILKAWFKIK